jgi:hypothetical protein
MELLTTSTPTKNQDLYWALSGGGPGAYGVVVSLTIRAFFGWGSQRRNPVAVMAKLEGGLLRWQLRQTASHEKEV